jgi:hypothetical protein
MSTPLSAPDHYGVRRSFDRTIEVTAFYDPSTANGRPGKAQYYQLRDLITKTTSTHPTLAAAKDRATRIVLKRTPAAWQGWTQRGTVRTVRTQDLQARVTVCPAYEYPGMFQIEIDIHQKACRGWLTPARTHAQACAEALAWADALIAGKATP